MTTSLLLAGILGVLLFQLFVGAGVFVWRRRGTASASPAHGENQPLKRTSGAWTGWREFRVARREFEDDAHTQCSFHLEPVDGEALPAFKPGQFLTFSLQLAGKDASDENGGRSIVRCYSLSDRPDPARYRVTIKRVPAPAGRPDAPPGVASGHFHDQVREGDVLKVKAPSGHFHIDPDPAAATVLIGGGIGITPMMSMLRWCLEEQPERELHLFHGVRSYDERAFKDVLEALAAKHPRFHLHVVCSRPNPDEMAGRDFQHTGHIDVELLRRTLPAGRHRFYICGPAPMMESLVVSLEAWGVARDDIRFEAFGPATVRLPDAAPPATAQSPGTLVEVRFQRAGRTLPWDGHDASLLDFAERHGVAIDSGCRSGSCGTCETKLVSGTVRYAHAPDHDITPGHCLPCVGTPESGLVLDA